MTDDDREKRLALLLRATDHDVDWDRVEYDEGERWAADITLLKGRLREVEQRAEKAEAAASDFAKLLDGIAHRPWSNTAAGTARDALARHSEQAEQPVEVTDEIRGTQVGRELDRVIVGLSTDLERLREAAREVDERWSEFWERSVSGYDATRPRERLREARAALHAALEAGA